MADEKVAAGGKGSEDAGAAGAATSADQPQGYAPPRPNLTLRLGEGGSAVTETLWSQVGGTETFERLVREFYAGVREDPALAPMYPAAADGDWDGAIWRLRAFLEQYWGGPTTYSEERGHPRLRLRHAPFPVTPHARDRWLFHMHRALDTVALPPAQDAMFRDYIERAATALVNTPGE